MNINKVKTSVNRQAGSFSDYLSIARFDHCIKHIFILPGVVLAYLLRGTSEFELKNVILGLIAALSIASANYVINEWLDKESDKFHPTKSQRASVQKELSMHWVMIEWLLFLSVGITSAYYSGRVMFYVALVFALQGIVYNVKPLRSKDKAYIDVISESINNPLRLMIGWAMMDPTSLPPASLLLSYWLGGAFLMAAKRLSEYRDIVASHGKALLAQYRISFAGYTELSLIISCFVYALLSNFFLAVFLIKYRVEYILTIPIVTFLFAKYLAIAMKPASAAQTPEKLYREKSLILLVLALACVFIFTSFVDIPLFSALATQQFIELR